jgi:DNA-binding transcriptional ArsR family regulator
MSDTEREPIVQDQLNSDRCSRYLKALGDPERLRIIQCLRDGPKTVSDISRRVESAVPNVSHHLKQLRLAGLVLNRRQGRTVSYRLSPAIVSGEGQSPLKTLDFGCCRLQLGKE